MKMACCDFEIMCIDKKNQTKNQTIITIGTEDYVACYGEEVFHLSDYPKRDIDKEVKKLKKEFIEEVIKNKFEDENIKLEYDIDFIMEGLDETVSEEEDGADIYPNDLDE
ncbi:hypothetical protein [Clostridium sp.]|uniref:hypothetical protein n=1 Tax=Clostridium sp. TaxID=1506 RepID=UPI003D6CA24F